MTKANEEITLSGSNANAPVLVQLMDKAMGEGRGPEYLRELLAVKAQWDSMEAKKSFNAAKHAFQSRCPIIPKEDKAHNKDYAKMDRIWRTIRPLIEECKLSTSWQICRLDAGNICHIEGKLSHVDGHEEPLAMDIPIPEAVPGQNKAQQMGSAYTYAKRYATCSALGIETGKDDNGFGAGSQYLSQEQANEINDLYEAARGVAGFNEKAFFGWIAVDAIEDIPASRFAEVKAMLKKKLAS